VPQSKVMPAWNGRAQLHQVSLAGSRSWSRSTVLPPACGAPG